MRYFYILDRSFLYLLFLSIAMDTSDTPVENVKNTDNGNFGNGAYASQATGSSTLISTASDAGISGRTTAHQIASASSSPSTKNGAGHANDGDKGFYSFIKYVSIERYLFSLFRNGQRYSHDNRRRAGNANDSSRIYRTKAHSVRPRFASIWYPIEATKFIIAQMSTRSARRLQFDGISGSVEQSGRLSATRSSTRTDRSGFE